MHSEQRAAVLEEKVKVAEEEAQSLARKSREAEEEIRRARESAVKVSHTLYCTVSSTRTHPEWRRKISNGETSVSCRRESSFNYTNIWREVSETVAIGNHDASCDITEPGKPKDYNTSCKMLVKLNNMPKANWSSWHPLVCKTLACCHKWGHKRWQRVG